MRAASGSVALMVDGPLIEAWAVLAETDEVGGPEEKIERFGVEKNEFEKGAPEPFAMSISEIERGYSRLGSRDMGRAGFGVSGDELEGRHAAGLLGCERAAPLRSERRSCKALDEISASSLVSSWSAIVNVRF